MSDAPAPPPFPSSGPSSPSKLGHATNMVRNIAVSVISTVLGATLIYYLGFKGGDGGGENTLVTKEATTKAWKSYVTVENIYYKNSMSLLRELQETKKFADFKENIIKESDKFQRDLPEVIKDKNIDGAFISMIQRRLDNERTIEGKMHIYLQNLQDILDANLSTEQRRAKLAAEEASWAGYNKGNQERSVTDVEDLAKVLSERYQVPFAMSDLLVYEEMKKVNANLKDNKTTQPNEANTNGNTQVPADPNAGNGGNTENNNTPTTPTDNKNETVTVNRVDQPKQNNSGADEKMLTGEWDTKDAGIDLYKNGTMYWNMDNGERASGTWKFINDQLYMYPRAGGNIANNTIWIFNLSNVTPNSFTMTLAYKPFNTYYLIRSNGQ